MTGGEFIVDPDIKKSDVPGMEEVPEELEDYDDDFEDQNYMDDMQDSEHVQEVVIEVGEIQQNQNENPILAIMQNLTIREHQEVEIDEEMLKLHYPTDQPTIESLYSLEKLQEIYVGITDLSEFDEFYRAYTRDLVELEANNVSRLNFVKELYLAWYRFPCSPVNHHFHF